MSGVFTNITISCTVFLGAPCQFGFWTVLLSGWNYSCVCLGQVRLSLGPLGSDLSFLKVNLCLLGPFSTGPLCITFGPEKTPYVLCNIVLPMFTNHLNNINILRFFLPDAYLLSFIYQLSSELDSQLDCQFISLLSTELSITLYFPLCVNVHVLFNSLTACYFVLNCHPCWEKTLPCCQLLSECKAIF